MYISSLGDGSSSEDGIYVLLKEVIDNSVDEFNQGFGKVIDVTVTETSVTVRDRGRGIPLGSVVDASSKLNTGSRNLGKQVADIYQARAVRHLTDGADELEEAI